MCEAIPERVPEIDGDWPPVFRSFNPPEGVSHVFFFFFLIFTSNPKGVVARLRPSDICDRNIYETGAYGY